MRTSVFEENGRKHLTVLSFQAIDEISKKYKNIERVHTLLDKGNMLEQFRVAAEVLVILMKCGDEYAKEFGIENNQPLTVEQIFKCCSPDDLVSMTNAIAETFSNSMKREIEIMIDPNIKTTLAEK